MKSSIAFVLLVLATPALFSMPVWAQGAVQPPPAAGAVGPATALTPSPDDRAKQWLGLVDDQNYADAYKQMGMTAQGKLSADAFAEKQGSTRGPLGAMATRTIKSIKMSNTLPGMRDGQYATVQFDSSFAHKAQATETVVLASDKGAWSVVSYSVN
jgi:hypothetical protein